MIVKATARNRKAHFICSKCGFIGHGSIKTKGSRFTEIMIWSILLFPGPIYSLWRYMSRTLVCPKCQSPDLVNLDTPRGQDMFDKALTVPGRNPHA